jgi:predicted peroxiredoxin
VKFSVCRDSLESFELTVEQLLPELDEVQKAEAFWREEVAQADQVLTF